MAQPTATGLQLSTNIGTGNELAKTTHGGFDYQWAFACWWEVSGNTPEVPTLASPFPVQPGTGTTWAISAAALPLPTGASTAANQATGNASLATLAGAVTGSEVQVDVLTMPTVAVTGTFWPATQPISAAALPLPSGAATEATLIAIAGYLDTEIAAILTAAQLLDNIVSGNEAQVDVITSVLPAGAATDAKLDDIIADTAAIQAAVEIMDDWDDGADNCKSIAQGGYVMDGATRCEVKHFHAVTNTSDTSIITAVAAKRFRILSMSIIGLSATATNVHLETKTTNTDCFGDSTNPIPVAVDADGDNHGGLVLDWNIGGWFETADANEDMAIILSAAQPVMIVGSYIEVT